MFGDGGKEVVFSNIMQICECLKYERKENRIVFIIIDYTILNFIAVFIFFFIYFLFLKIMLNNLCRSYLEEKTVIFHNLFCCLLVFFV